jgi:hypothetical protein
VVCYKRETGEELWRVVSEGLHKRVKVYPDGKEERFDGKGNFPKFQPMTEVLRLAPNRDEAKVAAAVETFRRFATESVSFTALAHDLSRAGFRGGFGGYLQGHSVEGMLRDPIYIGYYAWNRRHYGKFHRWAGDRPVPELNYEEQVTPNDEADWVLSPKLFEPLVDRETWDAVQRKLRDREKAARAPRSATHYLAGLLHCGTCGGKMVAGPTRKAGKTTRKDGLRGDRYEYMCGTYHTAVRERRRQDCKCLRNGVFQDEPSRVR